MPLGSTRLDSLAGTLPKNEDYIKWNFDPTNLHFVLRSKHLW